MDGNCLQVGRKHQDQDEDEDGESGESEAKERCGIAASLGRRPGLFSLLIRPHPPRRPFADEEQFGAISEGNEQ